jgi:hypothetical protein
VSLPAALRLTKRHMADVLHAEASKHRPEVEPYRTDPLSHLDAGHVTILGLETRQPVLFHPYDHEVELLDAWITVSGGHLVLRNVRGEKSRQMGWTWTVAYAILWMLMYWPVRLLAQHVDLGRIADIPSEARAPTDSLFGKIRFMAEADSWPPWAAPGDFLHFRHGPEHMIVSALSNGYVIGRGKEDDPATGGTYDGYLQDESARIPNSRKVEASVVSACPQGRIYISTPFGKDNVFYELKETPRADFTYLSHHWSIHPVYRRGLHVAGADDTCSRCLAVREGGEWDANDHSSAHRYPGKLTSPWYDQMVSQLVVDEIVAQELDISYERSLSARVYPEFSAVQHVVERIPYERSLGLEFSIDYGWAPSLTSIGIWQDATSELRKIGELEVQEMTPDQVAKALRQTLLRLGVFPEEVEPRFTRNYLMVGDPAGEARQIGYGESLVAMYRKTGWNVVSRRYPVQSTVIAFKRLLLGVPKRVYFSAETCPKTIRHMEQNRRETDRLGQVKQSFAIRNDEHNHMPRADAYYLAFKYPAPQEDGKDMVSSRYVPDGPYYRLSREEAETLTYTNGRNRGDTGLSPDMRL